MTSEHRLQAVPCKCVFLLCLVNQMISYLHRYLRRWFINYKQHIHNISVPLVVFCAKLKYEPLNKGHYIDSDLNELCFFQGRSSSSFFLDFRTKTLQHTIGNTDESRFLLFQTDEKTRVWRKIHMSKCINHATHQAMARWCVVFFLCGTYLDPW